MNKNLNYRKLPQKPFKVVNMQYQNDRKMASFCQSMLHRKSFEKTHHCALVWYYEKWVGQHASFIPKIWILLVLTSFKIHTLDIWNLGSYKFLAYQECIRSYDRSFGHSDPDPSSVNWVQIRHFIISINQMK